MTSEELACLMDAALLDGFIEAECQACGLEIGCEPDADSAWCEQCGRVVLVRNPLIEAGLV